MPRRAAHVVVGAAMGAVAARYLSRNEQPLFSLIETFAGGFGGAHGGRAPDELEPADTPNHRGLFHSVLGTVAGGAAVKKWAPGFVAEYRAGLARLREEIQYEPDPLKRALYWLLLACLHASLGYATGFTTGYASHLALDGALTPSSLPLLTNGF